jgi:hypothetical protein
VAITASSFLAGTIAVTHASLSAFCPNVDSSTVVFELGVVLGMVEVGGGRPEPDVPNQMGIR